VCREVWSAFGALTVHLTSPLSHSLDEAASARALLGADHPLARVSQRLGVRREQSLVVGAVLLASIVALLAGESAALWFVVAAAVVEADLACGSALLAQTRRDRVLDVIVDGRGSLPLAAVQRARRRLLDPAHRTFLARWLDAMRHDAQRPIRRLPATRPLYSVRVIRAVAPELEQIAGLLRSDHAGLRGVALMERMLRDGASSLYREDAESLRQELRGIRLLLEGRRPNRYGALW
jgi:hypothetical protein